MPVARIDTPLKQVLEREGRKQAWLAREIGADPAEVWKWVHGLHRPSDASCERIAQALGRSVDELFPVDPDKAAA